MKRLTLLQKLSRLHWLLLTLMLMLATASIFFIFSATHAADNPVIARAAMQQATWLALGCGVFLFLALVDYEHLVRYGWLLYAGILLLLLYVPFFGREVNNSRSWIGVGGFGIQPAEFGKLATICGMAWFIVRYGHAVKKLWFLCAVGVAAAIPMGLILLQPDFGSAAVFAPITFFILWAAGARKRYLMIPVAGVVAGVLASYWFVYRAEWDGTVQDIPGGLRDAVLVATGAKSAPDDRRGTLLAARRQARQQAWEAAGGSRGDEEAAGPSRTVLLKPYQLSRINTFYKPDLDPLGHGWTIRQSLIAVGSGGLKGKGYLRGDQNVYGFLPKDISYNDFIFSVIAEEFGFAGGALLICAQGLIILLIVRVAGRSKDAAGRILCAGVAGLWFTHFFINIGMTIKVVPITGIPLPLTSYGGTFLLSCMAALGIVQSVWINRRDY